MSRESKPIPKRFLRSEFRFLSDFLKVLTEASYAVLTKNGFRGSFLEFIHLLEEALEDLLPPALKDLGWPIFARKTTASQKSSSKGPKQQHVQPLDRKEDEI